MFGGALKQFVVKKLTLRTGHAEVWHTLDGER